MQQSQSIYQMLRRLWQYVTPKRRGQFILLLFLMIIASFAEIISIGAVLPFLAVLTSPDRIFQHRVARPIIASMGITSTGQLLLIFTISFGLAAFLVGAIRLLLLSVTTRLSYAIGVDFSTSIYHRTLYQPYSVHVSRNSSKIIDGILHKAHSVITTVILPILTLISSSFILIAILITLLSVEPFITLLIFSFLGLIYGLIIRITRQKLLINSQKIASDSNNAMKALQEGLGGIRDILINGSQKVYCQVYRNVVYPLLRAKGHNSFISQSPRFGMEAFGMMIIALLAYTLTRQPDGIAKAIPVLGALALGAQRLLPVLQQSYMSWSSVKGGQASLQEVLELLDQQLPDYVDQPAANPLPFNQHIKLKDLSFRYTAQAPWILKNLDLTIVKGDRIGFIGTTGTGKSTLLDIVMGLLQPSEGTLDIDGVPITSGNNRAWQAHIAHVPQTIFLADSTIEENIAFGIPGSQIKRDRVLKAAQQAQIADIIETWPKKYETEVGERGIRLSGGQRQRIGIARALYRHADVIIFDEATSALDSETELAVMQAIENLSDDLTILIIAHRLTTLRNCTQIVELDEGGIKRIGTYEDIVSEKLNENERVHQMH